MSCKPTKARTQKAGLEKNDGARISFTRNNTNTNTNTMSKISTMPRRVIFRDGSTEEVCCGRAILEITRDDFFGYQVLYCDGWQVQEECPNHPQPITEDKKRYREYDRIPLDRWFNEHAHDSRKAHER